MAEQRFFEDVEVGEEFNTSYKPEAAHVAQFFALTGSGRGGGGDGGSSSRFQSASTAKSEGLASPIVPGNMSLGLLTRLVTDWMGSEGHLRTVDVSYRRPVHHGDDLKGVGLVTHHDVDENGEAIVELDIYLENQRGERPLQGTATVELPKRS